VEAVDVQGLLDARIGPAIGEGGGVIHAILGRVPVGGPLAAGDAEEAALVDVNGVIARQGGGVFAPARFDKRADTGEHA
jgi:hypothetical protein